MSPKVIGKFACWSGATQLQDGFYPVIELRKGEEAAWSAVLSRGVEYPTLASACEAAMDAVKLVRSIDDYYVISFADGSTIQATQPSSLGS
ncbi:hypothetical protein D3C76_471150 [compost metagenome]|jgi:hypothetical protein